MPMSVRLSDWLESSLDSTPRNYIHACLLEEILLSLVGIGADDIALRREKQINQNRFNQLLDIPCR